MSNLLAARRTVDGLIRQQVASTRFDTATVNLTEGFHSRFELADFARSVGAERALVGRVVGIFAICRFTRVTMGKPDHRENPKIIRANMNAGWDPLLISDLRTKPLDLKGIGFGGLSLLTEFLQAKNYKVPKWIQDTYREKGA